MPVGQAWPRSCWTTADGNDCSSPGFHKSPRHNAVKAVIVAGVNILIEVATLDGADLNAVSQRVVAVNLSQRIRVLEGVDGAGLRGAGESSHAVVGREADVGRPGIAQGRGRALDAELLVDQGSLILGRPAVLPAIVVNFGLIDNRGRECVHPIQSRRREPIQPPETVARNARGQAGGREFGIRGQVVAVENAVLRPKAVVESAHVAIGINDGKNGRGEVLSAAARRQIGLGIAIDHRLTHRVESSGRECRGEVVHVVARYGERRRRGRGEEDQRIEQNGLGAAIGGL